jgi:hypothetical protein
MIVKVTKLAPVMMTPMQLKDQDKLNKNISRNAQKSKITMKKKGVIISVVDKTIF